MDLLRAELLKAIAQGKKVFVEEREELSTFFWLDTLELNPHFEGLKDE
jgi:hypothetical protein